MAARLGVICAQRLLRPAPSPLAGACWAPWGHVTSHVRSSSVQVLAARYTVTTVRCFSESASAGAGGGALAKKSVRKPLSVQINNKVNDLKLGYALRVAAVKEDPKIVLTWLNNGWKAIKSGAHHTYVGFKLLFLDVRVASSLLVRVVRGNTLKRRERQLLIRTAQDVARLVPFSFFIIIPFMELLLPVALRLFPNMLPSTFADKSEKETLDKKLLKGRLEMASFLQEVVEQKTAAIVQGDGAHHKDATRLTAIMDRMRNGEHVPNREFRELTTLFKDELTLDNLNRKQLTAMCNYMNIKPFGNDTTLKFLLRHKLQAIKRDDREIHWEGVESLTLAELRSACRARGIKAAGLEKHELQDSLRGWINMSMDQEVPSSLLILSAALKLNATVSTGKQKPAPLSAEESLETIQETIKSMPEDVFDQVATDGSSLNERLETLKKQVEVVKKEQEEEKTKADCPEPNASLSAEGDHVDVEVLKATSEALASAMNGEKVVIAQRALDEAREIQNTIKETVDEYDPTITKIDKLLNQVQVDIEKDTAASEVADSLNSAVDEVKAKKKSKVSISEVAEAFGGHVEALSAVDVDGDGIISRSDVENLIKLVDLNEDGVLSLRELKMYLNVMAQGGDQEVVLKLLQDAAAHRKMESKK